MKKPYITYEERQYIFFNTGIGNFIEVRFAVAKLIREIKRKLRIFN